MNPGHTPHDDEMLAANINMTPLIDVMLVLLVVFMVTLPVLHHTAHVVLPRARSAPDDRPTPHVDLALGTNGQMTWNAQPVANAALPVRLARAAAQVPQPEIRLFADRDVRYGRVATLLSEAEAAGLTKVGFVTDPAAARP
jgi:biopolymer transport protein ExbD